ncbi:MAG: flagellar motor switch protein FliG [Limnohabitans sp.]|jgi:flagellar motor switch protein FliG|uniref:flagellar motor switch protein FliG n=1 Tax=Limnohabitans sp. TaxID=1907725 RepID=UPI0011D8DD58|nr:MAG: flagellar motor switch protein FliG [Limnohabitans sp.]
MATQKEADKDPKGKDAKGKDGKETTAVTDPLALSDIVMTEELRQELDELTNTQRAAVLMLLLGEQQASEIIRFMNPREVQALGAAMVSVADLSQEAVNVVLDDFVATLKKQTSLGLGTGDYVEKVLKRALGDDKAASVLSRIMPGQGSKGLEILKWMDARSIADMIRSEHPQVVAIILSVLEYDVAADVLNYLPAESRPEIIQRIAKLETVQPSAMEELEAIMKKQFASNSSAKSSSFGGVKAAAKIMNFVKVELEGSIMKGLSDIDEDLTLRIQDNMFTFENLVSVDNRGIQTLMRAVEPDLLMIALKGAPDFVKQKFFDNMSSRARVMFIDDMEAKGPLRLTEVEEAQKKVMRLARKLSEAGELVLAGSGDDFV